MSATKPASIDLSTTTRRGPGYLRASTPLMKWRTVDLLTTTFLGAAFGVVFWLWGFLYEGPATFFSGILTPLSPLVAGPWLMAGVIGGLVVRRPGAAFLCEVVAALVSMLAGTKWGWTTLLSGVLQGIGAEIGFAILTYGVFTVWAAVIAGALAAPLEAIYEITYYEYTSWSIGWQAIYAGSMALSGAVCGVLAWVLMRALGQAGALNALPPGQELREARAV